MKNPARRWFVCCAALCLLASCATAPKPNAALKRLQLVDSQLGAQEAEIRRLTQTIRNLETKLHKEKKADKAPAPGVPLTRLSPEAPEEEDLILDEGWETAELPDEDPTPMREANVIADSRSETLNHYYRGLHYFEAKRFEKAQTEFRAFLKDEPKHVYADRAQYMELECHFENHDYGLAVFAANQLEAKFPYSLRMPEALHKRALSYLEMGQPNKATQSLRELLRRYPDASVADTASRLLAGLGQAKDDAANANQVWEGHARGEQ